MTDTLTRKPSCERKFPAHAIHAFLDALEAKKVEAHSFMLVQGGAVEWEGWWAPYAPAYRHMMFSLSKSFTSTAIGLAEAEGLLSVNDRVTSFFPEWMPADPSAELQAMRIHHLLSMSTGHDMETLEWIGEHGMNDNWVKGFFEAPLAHPPGTYFQYNTGATFLLSAILQQVTGVRLLDYLKPRLLEPLGIEGATWDTVPGGYDAGGFGLNIRTEDVAKFGQLYLQKGNWNGRQLVPAAWIERATSAQIANGNNPESDWNQGYGYQFWRCRHGAYRGDGMFGQFCIVLPEQDAVLAMTNAAGDLQAVLNAVWDHLLPGFGPSARPSGEAEQTRLETRLQGLALPLPPGELGAARERKLTGARYAIEPNGEQIEALAFDFGEAEATVTVRSRGEDYVLPFGRGAWRETESAVLNGQRQRIAQCMTWRDADTLLLTQCFVETPFTFQLACRFEGDAIRVEISSNVPASPEPPTPWIGNRV